MSLRCERMPDPWPAGVFLVAWAVLTMEGWRLPGARWVAVQTPMPVICVGLLLLPICLLALGVFNRIEHRGGSVPMWAGLLVNTLFLGGMVFAGPWVKYRFAETFQPWLGLAALIVVLGLASWVLARRRSRHHVHY